MKNCFKVSVFDKRDLFPFSIVKFAPRQSNQALSISYAVFNSQVIRYFRICNYYVDFSTRLLSLMNVFISLGFSSKRLQATLKRAALKHKFRDKFEDFRLIFNILPT